MPSHIFMFVTLLSLTSVSLCHIPRIRQGDKPRSSVLSGKMKLYDSWALLVIIFILLPSLALSFLSFFFSFPWISNHIFSLILHVTRFIFTPILSTCSFSRHTPTDYSLLCTYKWLQVLWICYGPTYGTEPFCRNIFMDVEKAISDIGFYSDGWFYGNIDNGTKI